MRRLTWKEERDCENITSGTKRKATMTTQ